jgi:hypothetical protein
VPETLAFLRRAMNGTLLDFEVPESFRTVPRHRYKLYAIALRERQARLAWPGQNQQTNDAAVLRRVAHGLQALRWETPDTERPRLDQLHSQITALLEIHAPVWDLDGGRYRVHRRLRDALRTLEQNAVTRPLVSAARAQLEDERVGLPMRSRYPGHVFTWHPGGVALRAAQLRKEIGGARNLDARLRDLARYHRAHGSLPPRPRSSRRGSDS